MAIVLELAKQGANIVIDYVAHPEATEALEKQVSALGDQAIGVEADVSKVADLQRLIAAAVKEFGRVDVMVNNAGDRDAHVDARHDRGAITRRCSTSTSRARSSAPSWPPSR